MTSIEQFHKVLEFMTIAGQEINYTYKEPTTGIGKFRIRLIEEEMFGDNELFYSIDNDNKIMVLDGICDVLYVAYGACATFGLTPNKVEIKVSDEPGRLLPMSLAELYKKHINDGFSQTVRGLQNGDMRTIQTGLNYIITGTIELGNAHNFDVISAFDEVHESNMSKFCRTKEDAERSVEIKSRYDSKYNNTYIEEIVVDGVSYFVIKRREDGKVLKGDLFYEPNLSDFVK